jgi:hypothetical protein
MGKQILSTPQIIVNNVTVSIKPNSFSYTEGFGEQEMRVQSAGGNSVETVWAQNVNMSLSDVKWEMEPTDENIELIRTWKINQNDNAITAHSTSSDGTLTRSFDNAALTNNYEVNLKSDGAISLEWKARPAV